MVIFVAWVMGCSRKSSLGEGSEWAGRYESVRIGDNYADVADELGVMMHSKTNAEGLVICRHIFDMGTSLQFNASEATNGITLLIKGGKIIEKSPIVTVIEGGSPSHP